MVNNIPIRSSVKFKICFFKEKKIIESNILAVKHMFEYIYKLIVLEMTYKITETMLKTRLVHKTTPYKIGW